MIVRPPPEWGPGAVVWTIGCGAEQCAGYFGGMRSLALWCGRLGGVSARLSGCREGCGRHLWWFCVRDVRSGGLGRHTFALGVRPRSSVVRRRPKSTILWSRRRETNGRKRYRDNSLFHYILVRIHSRRSCRCLGSAAREGRRDPSVNTAAHSVGPPTLSSRYLAHHPARVRRLRTSVRSS